jgi:signal transduction histidine kinase
LKQIKDASQELGCRDLTAAQKSEIEKLEYSLIQTNDPPPDVLTISTLEDELDSVLHSHGQNDLWQLSANLARKGAKPELLDSLFASLDADTARAALMRISALLEITGLLNEIENSTSRISDLVRAIREYTFMDQAPVQNVDLVKSLETTLIILNHKLKGGVEVERDYQPVPFLVDSFGSELNQVWTNLIDNAIDALHGRGKLRAHTYRDDTCAVVEIGDNGPGIPPEVQPHIFEPFFTTKGVGEGSGLGLDTVQRIVRKHRGSIQVSSTPGDTRFQVWLPLADPRV